MSVLVLVQVVGGIGNGSGLAVGGLLVKDITGSSGWSGMAVVMLTLGAAAFTIPLSSLAARSGRRPALTLGWLAGASGAAVTVVGAETRSLPVALVGLLLFGGSTAANLQSRFAAVDRAAPAQVGRSLSVVVWSTTVGAVIGPNLTGPGAAVAGVLGLPDLSGPMLFSATAFATSGLLTVVLLRPDPLIGRPAGSQPAPRGARAALPYVRGRTLTAIWVVASSHAVMVSVMALTPVHMEDHGASLEVIGLTISLHIAGMYALSPVMGWLADAWGQDRTILLGQAVLLLAAGVAGTSGDSQVQITVGLTLLGIGWSASVIAGAAALTTSVEAGARPLVQGFSDLAMNLAGASGGLLAGLVVALSGFGTLNAAAAVLTVPVVVLVLSGRRVAARTGDPAASDAAR
ncbi:MFS transporter [Aeromicrobium endophyticum]|uniref:MFS transporter n=1 Tax=Aeromicrobium endophyticum TaxID=2292704 RepID=UPI001F3CA272|nr:MFS transporter [Aeromicrobium endophyticum]